MDNDGKVGLLAHVALIALFVFCLVQCAHAQNNSVYKPIPSAAYTASQVNSPDMGNSSYLGGQFIINVSAYTSGSYTVKLQGKDPVSGVYYDILVGTALSSTGITILKLYPGIATSANAAASDVLPQTWRVQLNGAATPSMTLSVDAVLYP